MPRHGLPGGRAVVGGLLVAVAVLGTWWVGARPDQRTALPYLVAAHPIGPGERIRAGDLRAVPAELPPSLAAGAFTDRASLDGAVSLGPLEEGELIQAGAVGEGSGDDRGRELSFAIPTAWAVAGSLRPGDRIDLWVTLGSGSEADTDLVLADVPVRRISLPDDDGLGASGDQTITVSLRTLDEVEVTTNAARSGTLTATRSTDVAGAGG